MSDPIVNPETLKKLGKVYPAMPADRSNTNDLIVKKPDPPKVFEFGVPLTNPNPK